MLTGLEGLQGRGYPAQFGVHMDHVVTYQAPGSRLLRAGTGGRRGIGAGFGRRRGEAEGRAAAVCGGGGAHLAATRCSRPEAGQGSPRRLRRGLRSTQGPARCAAQHGAEQCVHAHPQVCTFLAAAAPRTILIRVSGCKRSKHRLPEAVYQAVFHPIAQRGDQRGEIASLALDSQMLSRRLPQVISPRVHLKP